MICNVDSPRCFNIVIAPRNERLKALCAALTDSDMEIIKKVIEEKPMNWSPEDAIAHSECKYSQIPFELVHVPCVVADSRPKEEVERFLVHCFNNLDPSGFWSKSQKKVVR